MRLEGHRVRLPRSRPRIRKRWKATLRLRACAGAGVTGLVFASLANVAGAQELPSFLGADSLKALEAARAEREAEAMKLIPGQPAPAAGAANPAPAAPAAGAAKAERDKRKVQEDEAKRRAEAMKRLAPEGGVKHLSPQETELLEAENAAKARADQRVKDLAAGGAQAPSAGTVTTSDPATSAAALGQAADQIKELLKDAGAPEPQQPMPSITLMQKLPTAPEIKPAPAPAAPPVQQRSPGGKLSDPLPAEGEQKGLQYHAAACPEAKIATQSVTGGRMRIDVDSPCRGAETARIQYGDVTFERALDKAGRLSFTLDLFQGRQAALAVAFKDETRQPVAIASDDLDKVSKVAVTWRAPVNLDLHAFEYTTIDGQKGHVWAGAPESAETASALTKSDGRGHGFLSFQSDASGSGDKVEVYTFWHVQGQDGGIVTLAVDNETRGANPKAEFCGTGALASVEMHVWRLARGAAPESEDRMLAGAACGTQLTQEVRYNPDTMLQLRIR